MPAVSAGHDPEVVVTELAAKLSTRARHVCALFGAGAARAAGLPDLAGLQEKVRLSDCLTASQRAEFEVLLASRNLEEVLSYLRRLAGVLGSGQTLGGFTAGAAEELHRAITTAIAPALDISGADLDAFRYLANWVAGDYYQMPIEIFTINYDLLIESGLEALGVPYFDGFVGSIAGQFRPELVDAIDRVTAPRALPATFVRLWKLHGSVNWEESTLAGRRQILRRGYPVTGSAPVAIYPSDEKYDQSRRMPFIVLMDRLRRALATPETLILIAGYSFRDQHLNEMLFDAARAYPRSETVVFEYGDISAVVAEVGTSRRNVSVYATSEAIIGGFRASWTHDGDIPGIWEAGTFRLGDFAYLARYLATQVGLGDRDD